MSRTCAALALLGLLLTLTACGGTEEGGDAAHAERSTSGDVTLVAPKWAGPYLSMPGPEGAAVMATSDYAVGANRVSFLLVRANNSLIRAPEADVYYRPDEGGSTRRALARLLPIGVGESTAADEVKEIYVARLDFSATGKHWIVVQPRGASFQGFQILEVKENAEAVAIGEPAPRSDNPTTETLPAERITTARPPDTALLRYSVAESLDDRVPFVVAFATPAYCESRTCGPTVDVVEAARRRYERRGIRFIHVEIYENNVPGNGLNRWVKEWRLPTEPWVYVVDRTGTVRDRFEGAVSLDELVRSIRERLL